MCRLTCSIFLLALTEYWSINWALENVFFDVLQTSYLGDHGLGLVHWVLKSNTCKHFGDRLNFTLATVAPSRKGQSSHILRWCMAELRVSLWDLWWHFDRGHLGIWFAYEGGVWCVLGSSIRLYLLIFKTPLGSFQNTLQGFSKRSARCASDRAPHKAGYSSWRAWHLTRIEKMSKDARRALEPCHHLHALARHLSGYSSIESHASH